jgi:hypothetical protein
MTDSVNVIENERTNDEIFHYLTDDELLSLESTIFKFTQLLSERLHQKPLFVEGAYKVGIKGRTFTLTLTIRKTHE